MNESKKLLYIRIIVVAIVLLFVTLFILLMIKIDIIGNLFGRKSVVKTKTHHGFSRYLDDVNSREYKEKEMETRYVEEKEKKIEIIEIDKSIFKYIERIKNKRNGGYLKISDNEEIIDNTSNTISTKDEYIYKKERNRIQDLYDNGYYDKGSWILIAEDKDLHGYNYYFDNNGKLIYDTVSPDYKIVDRYGREVDDDLAPVLYKLEIIDISTKSNLDIKQIGLISNKVIITEGVVLKNKDNLYDNTMDRNVLSYVDKFLRFKKTTNGTVYDGSKWRKASTIKDDGGYVIFNNPKNNFNKIIGKITTQQLKTDEETDLTLLVYDADLYDLYSGFLDILEPLYETSRFNNSEPLSFSFTFFRTVKRLRFQIESNSDKKDVTCYLKDLRYGFDKSKYKEELEEAKENAEYISYLKELGIIKTHEEIIADLKELYEDTTSDYLEYEDFNDIDLYNYVDLSDFDRNVDIEQMYIDKRTGPAFDEYLRSLKNYWEIEYGPGFE